MKRMTLPLGLAAGLMALPAASQQVRPALPILRDSDGIVISVLDSVDYFPGSVGVGPGGVYYTFNGELLPVTMMADGSAGIGPVAMAGGPATVAQPGAAAGEGPTLSIGGRTYAVEAAGDAIFLRDKATGARFATERRIAVLGPDAAGLRVNPQAFGLD